MQHSQTRKRGRRTEQPSIPDLPNLGYYQLFTGAIGKAILDDLKAQFCARGPFIAGDPYATHLNIGAQEVIRYIEERIRNENITTEV